jgi:uncharacterized protein YkwD
VPHAAPARTRSALRAIVLAAAVLAVFALGASPAPAAIGAHRPHTVHVHHHGCRARTRSHHRRRCHVSSRTSRGRSHTSARRAALREAKAVRAQILARENAAAIAAALAAPCPGAEVSPNGENAQLVREATLCLINRERAQHGEMPLRLNASLQQAAEGHCTEMIAEGYFEHVSPSGLTPAQRIRQDGYISNPGDGYVIGENLAWGTYTLSTPQAIVDAWLASPEHLANILESRYTETGLAVTPSVPGSLAEGAPGATYAQEFGVLIAPATG